MKSPNTHGEFERPYRIRHMAPAGSHLAKLAIVRALWHIVVREATKTPFKEKQAGHLGAGEKRA